VRKKKKNNGPGRRRQDFASRLDVPGLSDDEIAALIEAARPAEIRAFIAAMSPVDQMRMALGADPERLALLRAAGVEFKLTGNVGVVPGGDTKHGTGRRWGKLEWVSRALMGLSVDPRQSRISIVHLTDSVNDWLKQQPTYRRGKVSRWVVRNALTKWRDANASPRKL
jgi:hypothetical protein